VVDLKVYLTYKNKQDYDKSTWIWGGESAGTGGTD
jgi:hypothetical protein